MKTIWKFPLKHQEAQNVPMPDGAKILTVQMQGAVLCLWAAVDTKQPSVYRRILIYGTGHEIADERQQYIGTFLVSGGTLVFHVFEWLGI